MTVQIPQSLLDARALQRAKKEEFNVAHARFLALQSECFAAEQLVRNEVNLFMAALKRDLDDKDLATIIAVESDGVL